MKHKLRSVLTWAYYCFIVVSYMAPGVIALATRPENDRPTAIEILFPVVPLAFAFVGSLIISRKPGNRIGLLMLLPTLSFFPVVDAYLRPFIKGFTALPPITSAMFRLILWFSNWNWILFVFPAIFMILVFPTGRMLSARWNGLGYFGLFLTILLPISATLSRSLSPGSVEVTWSYPNPIGFLDEQLINKLLAPFVFFFPAWILLCVVSLFARFHRAQAVEREQIKWLFFAAAVFAVCYIPTFFMSDWDSMDNLLGLLFAVGMLAFPFAIAIAIFRYRLYDIDIIIRRTLQYTLLSGLLALVYFGGVTVLQSLFTAVSGQQSAASLVLSTLAIAALFNPLRKRIQDFIDRRFYRQKYDAEKALAAFAEAARSETGLEALTSRLTGTVQETLQPEQVNLWIYEKKS